MRQCAKVTSLPSFQRIRNVALLNFKGELLYLQTTGILYLAPPDLHDLPGGFQRWLWQVGILQRAFPNSTLRLDNVVDTADGAGIHHLLSCTELRGVTICLTPTPGGQAMATLGRLHGSRLQLQVPQPAFPMLEAEPALAAHVSQAALPHSWSAFAGSALADQISRLSSLTHLRLPVRDPALEKAGMLDALRQLPTLQSLFCMGHNMQTLLLHSVPRSWPLLTKLHLMPSCGTDLRDALGLVPCGAAVSPAAGTGCAQGRIAVPDGPDQPDLPLLGASRHRQLSVLSAGPPRSSGGSHSQIAQHNYQLLPAAVSGHGQPPTSAPEKPAVPGAHLFRPLVGSFRHPKAFASHSPRFNFCDVC